MLRTTLPMQLEDYAEAPLAQRQARPPARQARSWRNSGKATARQDQSHRRDRTKSHRRDRTKSHGVTGKSHRRDRTKPGRQDQSHRRDRTKSTG